MSDSKTILYVFLAVLAIVYLSIASMFILSAMSNYSRANTQLESWDTVTIDAPRIEPCAKGNCIFSNYFYNNTEYTPRHLPCYCSGYNLCPPNQSIDILVNPSDPESTEIKACAQIYSDISNVHVTILIMGGIGLLAVLLVFLLWKKSKK